MSRFLELKQKIKDGSATAEEKEEFAKLSKRGRKGKGPRAPRSESGSFRPGNDFSWWNKVPELLADAANYKSNYIAGTAIAGLDIPYVIPGVLVYKLCSTYGNNVQATDAINVWARDLYLRMFQKYRPVTGYSASDLGITLIAALEVVKLIAKYERIYGVINRYSVMNVNMPLVEAQALGLSVTQVTYLQAHLSDFRYDLNFLIRKAQRLCIPKDISAISDAISLFGYEYLDHENTRGQIIMFDFEDAGVYDETTLTSGGAIMYQLMDNTFPVFNFSADNMCEALDYTLQQLIGSDSVQRIFADLVVWFGQEAMLQFLPIPEDYIVAPAYSESILHKMHNMEMFDKHQFNLVSWADPNLGTADAGYVNNGSFWIYQCNDRIITKGGVIYNGGGTNTADTIDSGTIITNSGGTIYPCTTNAHVLDTYRVDVNPETVTEGILLKNHARVLFATGSVTMLDSCGFYIVKKVELHSSNSTTPITRVTTDGSASVAAATAGELAILDWAPLSYFIVASSGTCTIQAVFGDLDSVVPIYGNGLAKLQRTILLSGLHTDVKVIGSSK